MKKSANIFCKILNFFTPKIKHSMYISTPFYTVSSFMDVVNCSSSNAYSFANAFINKCHSKTYTVFIEYFHDERMDEYILFKEKAKLNNVIIIFVKHYKAYSGKFKRLFYRVKNLINKYKTFLWITETGDQGSYGKLQCQRVICLNYYISCKNDLIEGNNERWDAIDILFTSSLLHSQIISSSVGVKLEKCIPIGMIRNDSLQYQKNRKQILDDIEHELGYHPNFIFVYAPTFRDYEDGSSSNRDLLGYPTDNFSKFLIDNKIAFVYKLHRAQESRIVDYPSGTINFKLCYDYSFYDLLAIADCLITDYSSIGFDFMLREKPIIYNLYDWELYERSRGMSYEPYDEFCPGLIVRNYDELIEAMKIVVKGGDLQKEKRDFLKKIIFKYADYDSTKRAIDYIVSIL